MAKISTYVTDSNVTLADKLIGTDADDLNITKNFTVGSIVGLVANNIQVNQVLNAPSFLDQEPLGLDTPLIVNFGAAQGTVNDDVMIDSLGKVTFNTTGLYLINGFGSVSRQGSSGGVAIFAFRGVYNGVQASETKTFQINTTGISIPYEVTVPFQVTAGDQFWFEVMRDSSGVDQGGLYPTALAGGWSQQPSSQLQIWKIG